MRPGVILLVDDAPQERELIQACLEGLDLPLEVYAVRDGEQALAHLQSDKPRPHLVLIDLNMPGGGGHEVLTLRADDADLRTIPFVVLSGSESEDDVELAYALGANSYVVKPADFDRLREMLGQLLRYWFETARVPSA